jgi:hypothetical protein
MIIGNPIYLPEGAKQLELLVFEIRANVISTPRTLASPLTLSCAAPCASQVPSHDPRYGTAVGLCAARRAPPRSYPTVSLPAATPSHHRAS